MRIKLPTADRGDGIKIMSEPKTALDYAAEWILYPVSSAYPDANKPLREELAKLFQSAMDSSHNAAIDEAAKVIDPYLETSDCTACNRHLKDCEQAILTIKRKTTT